MKVVSFKIKNKNMASVRNLLQLVRRVKLGRELAYKYMYKEVSSKDKSKAQIYTTQRTATHAKDTSHTLNEMV